MSDQAGNSSGPFFPNARNFSISDSHFTQIGRDQIINIGSDEHPALSDLSRCVSTSALYDAEARSPRPFCPPGTREEELNTLQCWVSSIEYRRRRNTVEDSPSVYWLCGLEGAGKSAVAQTLAETYAESTTLTASFFFGRSDSSRNNAHRLFTTIAFQLAFAIPQLCGVIESVIQNEPAVLTSSIETQFERLILRPCFEVSEGPSPVDQRRILWAIGNGIRQSAHILPFKILITSRPEPHIRDAFNGGVPLYRRMSLDPPSKTSIRTFIYGLLFFGWVNFIFYLLLGGLRIVPYPHPNVGSIWGIVKVASKPMLKSLAEITLYDR
ncbi:hypothetical protein BDP27DRAFT_1322335 [Rhodocollybia butyracea]|uniref:Nephrocystin 3-like N-terminal domain-containing protein n=1 Tax=Rhodocollybia butyracea TaxID=206335 RepID=A0A9P5U9U5_9AGAR|nr:hypothetical protein BDP27DRAFT_1322335 [Rhodocollybia butyracea]